MNIRNQLNKVKPKLKNESDKYSVNLYKVLAKINKEYKQLEKDHGSELSNDIKFYFAHRDLGWDNKYIPFTEELFKEKNIDMNIVVSPFGRSSSGYFLSSILKKGLKAEHFSMCVYDHENFTDITDWFWNKYIEIGRCIFDWRHNGWMLGDKDRYYHINSNNKKCKWCDKHFHREIVKEVKINRKERWNMEV